MRDAVVLGESLQQGSHQKRHIAEGVGMPSGMIAGQFVRPCAAFPEILLFQRNRGDAPRGVKVDGIAGAVVTPMTAVRLQPALRSWVPSQLKFGAM